MEKQFFFSNFLVMGIISYIACAVAITMFVNSSASLPAQYITGSFFAIFFFSGSFNIWIHIDAKKKGIQLKASKNFADGSIYVRIPNQYAFEYVLGMFLIFAIVFGGMGPVLYYETGKKVQLIWIIFFVYFGIPSLVGLLLYIKNVLLKKPVDEKFQKKKIAGIVAFIAGAMVAVPIFIIGIIGFIIAGVRFDSILMTGVGGFFCVLLATLATSIFKSEKSMSRK
ncbi:MAG: hypothetical protein GY730_02030 [bacterium]|nr:hypothetical protein [bacterium]